LDQELSFAEHIPALTRPCYYFITTSLASATGSRF